MSVSQSNLSAPGYGYDVVVATTQSSINSTIKEFLSNSQAPQVIMCYVSDGTGQITPIDYATLVANAKQSDPFNVPANADPATDPDVQNLAAANFVAAFKAQIGLPGGYALNDIPDPVAFTEGSAAVSYSLLCSQFMAVQYTPAAGSTPASWLSESQQPGAAWLFTSNVAIQISTASPGAYNQLPPDVQTQIKNMGSTAFSVQQLLFDFDTATLQSTPTIQNVTAGTPLYNCLEADFIGQYFTTLQQNGQPLLGCSIVQTAPDTASLTISDINMCVEAFVDTNGQPIPAASLQPWQQELFTFNFLCAANNDPLPAPAQFNWNWLDTAADGQQYDGAIAVNVNAFAAWLSQVISPFLAASCITPKAYCKYDDGGIAYDLGFSRSNAPQQYMPLPGVAIVDGIMPVLGFHYMTSNTAHGGQVPFIWGELKCVYILASGVSLGNGQIQIINTITVYLDVDFEGGHTKGNYAAYQSTMLFDISVNATGSLQVTLQPYTPVDISQPLNISGWGNAASGKSITKVVNDIKSQTQQMAQSFMNGLDGAIQASLNGPQNWIFPGGNTFFFKDVAFSETMDLVAHITYADPS